MFTILRYSAKHFWPCFPNSQVPEKNIILESGVVLLCWILLQNSSRSNGNWWMSPKKHQVQRSSVWKLRYKISEMIGLNAHILRSNWFTTNTAVLFSKNWLFCWVQCVLSATFYVTAIILRCTKNIYTICNCGTTSSKSTFPDEYSSVISSQID